MYYSSLIMSSENKSKTAWNIIKIESGKSNTTMHLPSFFKFDDSIIHSDYVDEVFNDYFCNLINKLNVNSPSMVSAMQLLRTSFPNGFSTLKVVPLTDAEVLCTITSLKNKHSTGYDSISNRILKLCGQYISKPLAYIYNKCLTIGVFPDWLKYARIVLLFKKGDRSFIFNYRPISILTGFSKFFKY
jgi:Notch-like protein